MVADFEAMTSRLKRGIAELQASQSAVGAEAAAEALAFLRWLDAENFIFLGTRDYVYAGGRDTGQT